MAHQPTVWPRPTLLFDGDCGFCTRSAELVQSRLRPSPSAMDVRPWQRADLPAFGLSPQECTTALQWVDADGTIEAGHRAVAACLRACRWWCRPFGRLLVLPGIDSLAARAYAVIAAHRHELPGGTPACALPPAA